MAELHVAHEVVAVGIHAEHAHEIGGHKTVALRLRHLLALGEQKTVAEYRVRDGHAGGHEHRGPDDAVEAGDILAHEVVLNGPAAIELGLALGVAVADAREVRDERVGPHVEHVALIPRHGDAPVEAGTGDGQILQAALHEGDDLVATADRPDEVRMLVIEGEEFVLELGELEEPVLLARGLVAHRALAVGAHEFAVLVLLQIALGVVGLLMDAVPALVGALVQPAFLVQIGPELLHGARLAILSGAHEVGVVDIQRLPRIGEGGGEGIAPGLRGHAVLLGGLGDLLAVLVGAGDERHVVAVHTLVASNGVGGHRGIGGTQMRRGVDVVDGRGDAEGSLRHNG